jgi:hypothetical protein
MRRFAWQGETRGGTKPCLAAKSKYFLFFIFYTVSLILGQK